MRVNVYGEEYNDQRVELVTKVVDDEHTFYGLRLYLKFPNQEWWIHRKVDGQPDDDSSAITIWGASKMQLRDLLSALYDGLEEPTALTAPGMVPVADGLESHPWGHPENQPKFEESPVTTFGYGSGPAGEYGIHPIKASER